MNTCLEAPVFSQHLLDIACQNHPNTMCDVKEVTNRCRSSQLCSQPSYEGTKKGLKGCCLVSESLYKVKQRWRWMDKHRHFPDSSAISEAKSLDMTLRASSMTQLHGVSGCFWKHPDKNNIKTMSCQRLGGILSGPFPRI